MRIESHGTWIACVRAAVDAWRKRNDWSMATVVQEIVDHHERSGAASRTGIRFEPRTRDPFDRMRVNSERVYRWLDEGKDNNLLGLNFTESILAAMPDDLRLACVNTMLVRHCGLAAHVADGGVSALRLSEILKMVIKESGDAEAAMVSLLDGATIDELMEAQRQFAESTIAHQESLRVIEAELMRQTAAATRGIDAVDTSRH